MLPLLLHFFEPLTGAELARCILRVRLITSCVILTSGLVLSGSLVVRVIVVALNFVVMLAPNLSTRTYVGLTKVE
jgi:hypothetical protein